MSALPAVSAEQRRLTPMLTAAGAAMLRRLSDHPCAPRWNYRAGDQLGPDDHRWLAAYAGQLRQARRPADPDRPSAAILDWIESLRPRVPALRERIPPGYHLARDWSALPASSREDLARGIERWVPDDAPLDGLICYATSGTTGHVLTIPSSARTAAAYLTLTEHALGRHGVDCRFDCGQVAGFLIGAQASTIMHPAVLTQWGEAGYAKLNLNPDAWPHAGAAARYFEELAPALLTGDPISFAELLRQDLPARPRGIVSTAVALSGGLRRQLEARYGCPVIDLYSLNEAGPLAYSCVLGEGFHWLPPDIYPELIGLDGRPVAPGERGELTVSGGRNPYLPLLRYRTGDWCRLDSRPCPCGDPMPRLLELEGRTPVVFRGADGGLVNPVDISRVLREFPLVQHQLTQHRDGRCELRLRPLDGHPDDLAERVRESLATLLGPLPLSVAIAPTLGDDTPGGKAMPYRSEWRLEDVS